MPALSHLILMTSYDMGADIILCLTVEFVYVNFPKYSLLDVLKSEFKPRYALFSHSVVSNSLLPHTL